MTIWPSKYKRTHTSCSRYTKQKKRTERGGDRRLKFCRTVHSKPELAVGDGRTLIKQTTNHRHWTKTDHRPWIRTDNWPQTLDQNRQLTTDLGPDLSQDGPGDNLMRSEENPATKQADQRDELRIAHRYSLVKCGHSDQPIDKSLSHHVNLPITSSA